MTAIRSMTSRSSASVATPDDRPISVRLDDERLNDLKGLADIDSTNTAEQIRLAVSAYVNYRRTSVDLEGQIEAAVMRFRSSIQPLVSGPQGMLPWSPEAPRRALDSEKNITIRLGQASVEYLTSLALLDGFTVADEVRAAVDGYVASRRRDPRLNEHIESARIKRDRRFARLLGGERAS